MSTLIFGLFLLGIGLVMVEVIVPGGILGVAGALCMVGGVVASFYEYGPTGGMIAFAGSCAALAVCLLVEFRLLPRSAIGRRLFLKAQINGRTGTPVGDGSLLDRHGLAETALAPSGFVVVEGRRLEASSRSGFIEAGTAIVVKGRDSFRYIVEKL